MAQFVVRTLSAMLLISRCVETQWWQSAGNKCRDLPQKGISSRTTFEYKDRKVCYFVVDGASDRANSWKSSLMWDQNKKFDILTALEICLQQGATLPILKTKEEEQHVMDNYHAPKSDSVALDLAWTRNVTGYMWADGTPLDAKIPDCHSRIPSDQEYSYTAIHKEKKMIVWYDHVADDSIWNGVVVVCRQEFLDTLAHILATIVLGAIVVIVVIAVKAAIFIMKVILNRW